MSAWSRFAAALVFLQLGCPKRQAWQYDESRRIDEVMKSNDSDRLAALEGTAFAAPPSPAAPLSTSSYQIQQSGAKKRSQPHRNSRAAKRRGDELTSAAAEEGSASRRR